MKKFFLAATILLSGIASHAANITDGFYVMTMSQNSPSLQAETDPQNGDVYLSFTSYSNQDGKMGSSSEKFTKVGSVQWDSVTSEGVVSESNIGWAKGMLPHTEVRNGDKVKWLDKIRIVNSKAIGIYSTIRLERDGAVIGESKPLSFTLYGLIR
jgi:hypothetical protein